MQSQTGGPQAGNVQLLPENVGVDKLGHAVIAEVPPGAVITPTYE